MTVLAFPAKPKADIAAEARDFADAVDAGRFASPTAAIVITSGEGLETHYWGEGLNLVDAIGILETAKHYLIRRLIDE